MDLRAVAKVAINTPLSKVGFQIVRYARQGAPGSPGNRLPRDFTEEDIKVWAAVRPYTMTSPERIYSLCRCVEYLVANSIPGDFVECGVWKGGSSMAIALTLAALGDTTRHLYLYDTFEEGWPESSEEDVTFDGITPQELYRDALERGETPETFLANVEDVREALLSTGYPDNHLHLIKGKVEDTVPGQAPEKVALLRLDTDWYVSTRHELLHLYPRLSTSGVLMIDDYGLFKGARKATDTYFKEHNVPMLLHRVDDSGYRVGIKPRDAAGPTPAESP